MEPDVLVGHFRFNRWTNKPKIAKDFSCDTFEEALELVYDKWGLTKDDLIVNGILLGYSHKSWLYNEYILIRAA